MEGKDFFGEYNCIYFLQEKGRIGWICDRAHRRRPVQFSEAEVEDLVLPRRPRSTLYIGAGMPRWLSPSGGFPGREDTRTVQVEGRPFVVTGQYHELEVASGFGRSLRYQVVATQDDRAAVLLTVRLRARVRYRIAWDARA